MMMGFEEDGGGDFCSRCIGAAESMLDWLCPLVAIGRLGVAFGFLMMCVGVLLGHFGPVYGHPLVPL